MAVSSITITDPVYVKQERFSAFDRWLLNYIRDERDLVFPKLVLRILLVMLPLVVWMYWPGQFSWWVAVVYLTLNWAIFLAPYILMLHCTSHRPLFKREYDWMNNFIPWFVGPLFGETPETYFGHHMGMHHPENNLKDDLSTTMPYQRDSFAGFMHYWATFFFGGIKDLYDYFTRKNRLKLRRNITLGELSWYAAVLVLSIVNFKATLVVLILPFIFTRFMMMAGNWGQHAFIDADAPANCYRNSITCINTPYNRKCFNDGYHIVHHLKPAMHYTDMAQEFIDNRADYVRERAIVFQGIDFFGVWFLLMTKNYKALAKRYVNLEANPKSEAEIIALLKERTARIPAEKMI
jgi:fatty acid desaturase